MDRNPRLNVKCSDFIIKNNKERKFFYHFFCAFQYLIMNNFCHLPTQVIKPMFLGHVLDFEKAEQILEGLIVCQCMTFPQQTKQKNMDPFIFIFPNLPQIQLINYIAMKIGNIQGFIFLVYKIIKVCSHQKLTWSMKKMIIKYVQTRKK